MNIVIIDGQGGQLGAQLFKEISTRFSDIPDINIKAVGTNALATSAMLKVGAKNAATGENPVVVSCRTADVIIGPVGIVIADSLLGEITPKMALSVGQSGAIRILIPMNRCDNIVAGVSNPSTATLISDAAEKLDRIIRGRS